MGKTAFLFSGQGAQYAGMMRNYYESVPGARHIFDIADDTLGRPISHLCFEGPQDELNMTHNTQPCVLAADLAACEAALAAGHVPDALAGFSLGEYAALVAAGCMRTEDVFPLVQLRADAMQRAVPVGDGAMAAVMKMDSAELERLCESIDGYVACANFNSPTQVVVSGETEAVDSLVAMLKERKVRAMKLPVSAPFHCKLMEGAADELRSAILRLKLGQPRLPVYMNVDALPLESAAELPVKMIAQMASPVLWRQTLEQMWEDGFTTFLECGPGSTLSGFVKKTLPNADVVNI